MRHATDVSVLNFSVISSEKGTVTENIIALHACILFFSLVISVPHVKWIMVTLNSLRPVGYGYGWNGYGFLLPAGCWVEVAELAAACWCLVTRSPSATASYRWVDESNFIKSRGWVMFQKFEFQCSRKTSHVLVRDQGLLCVGW